MRELTTMERQEVNGGWIIPALALAAAVIGSVAKADYESGKDQAERDNANAGITPAG